MEPPHRQTLCNELATQRIHTFLIVLIKTFFIVLIIFSSSSIANEVGDKQIDVLKIDIEGSEWNILDKFIDQDLDQIDVKQICIEIHLNHRITQMSLI